MPNSENHSPDLPKTPPRANQGDIPKAKQNRVRPSQHGVMLPKLNMHTHKVDGRIMRDLIDDATGNNREVGEHGPGVSS